MPMNAERVSELLQRGADLRAHIESLGPRKFPRLEQQMIGRLHRWEEDVIDSLSPDDAHTFRDAVTFSSDKTTLLDLLDRRLAALRALAP